LNYNVKRRKIYIRKRVRVWLRLIFKVFFTRKYIKIIFFKKKLFLTSGHHQTDLKTLKKINLKKKKFFKNTFKTQKETETFLKKKITFEIKIK